MRGQLSRQAPEGKGRTRWGSCRRAGARAPRSESSGFSSVPFPISRVCWGEEQTPDQAIATGTLGPSEGEAVEACPEAAPEGVGSGNRGCGSRLASLRHLGGQGPPPAGDAPDPRFPGLWAGRPLPGLCSVHWESRRGLPCRLPRSGQTFLSIP